MSGSSPHSSTPPLLAQAILRIRLLGLLFLLLGSWQALGNLIDGWIEFDPTYFGYFLRVQLLRPGLALVLGLLLCLNAKRVGRWICRGLGA
jgi:hypothetical protein